MDGALNGDYLLEDKFNKVDVLAAPVTVGDAASICVQVSIRSLDRARRRLGAVTRAMYVWISADRTFEL